MINIPLIPYYCTKIDTHLSFDAAIHSLRQNVESDFNPESSSPFCGSVIQNGFTITRKIKGRDSFLPLIKGVFNYENGRTSVQIIAYIQPGVIIAGIVVLHIFALGLLKANAVEILLVIAAVFLFHCFIYILFLFEVQKAERLLKSILKSN